MGHLSKFETWLRDFNKLRRYAVVYGTRRSLIKALGRKRFPVISWRFLFPLTRRPKINIAIIGCGQFAFTTVAYFTLKHRVGRIKAIADVSAPALHSFGDFYDVSRRHLLSDSSRLNSEFFAGIDIVYICSNHNSHWDYYLMAAEHGCVVHVEKPLVVSDAQLLALKQHEISDLRVGYNRPHSKLIEKIPIASERLSLAASIFGHLIPDGHWYRDPSEGTRIAGNLGHWLDLFLYLLNKADRFPESIEVSISYLDKAQFDDNFCIGLSTPLQDFMSIHFSSIAEPPEGVYESIMIQQESHVSQISDFREVAVLTATSTTRYRAKVKDVGHSGSVLQVTMASKRSRREILAVSTLVVEISNAVKEARTEISVSLADLLQTQ